MTAVAQKRPCSRLWRLLTILFLILAAAIGNGALAQSDEPLAGDRAEVGLYLSPPFVNERDGTYEGMAIDIWERAAGNLDIASHYVVYPTFRDLVRATRDGEVDIAVTNLTITRVREKVLDFTQPWYDAGLRIMVADTSPSGFSGVIAGLRSAGHLRAYAWLALVIAVATVAMTLFDRRFDREFPRKWQEGISESLYHVVSIATSGKATRKNLFGWKGRIWGAFWMICGVAVVAYITSSVTSVMTTVSLESGIHSLADLSDNVTGVFTGSASEEYLRNRGIRVRTFDNIDSAVDALQAARIDAIVADAPILEYYAHRHPDENVSVVGNLFHPDKYGFAVRQQSPLAERVTLELLELHELGVIEQLRLRYFGSMP